MGHEILTNNQNKHDDETIEAYQNDAESQAKAF